MKIPRTPRILANYPLPVPALERPPPPHAAWPLGTNPRGSGAAAFLVRAVCPARRHTGARRSPAGPLGARPPSERRKAKPLDSETPPEPPAPGAPFSLYSV